MAEIQKVRYTHDAMIDVIIADPAISQGQIAHVFGFTEGWVSQVITSDAFQARLADRKGELIDPAIVRSIEERLKGLAVQSTQVLADSLSAKKDPELAAKVLGIVTKALGYGARDPAGTTINNYVVALPEKRDSRQWLEAYAPSGDQEPILIEAKQA